MTFQNGDVPTWLAALGTIGALIAALAQIATERRRRHADEESGRAERRQEHARHIAAMPGPEEQGPPSDPIGGRTAIDCANSSLEPVYNIVVSIVFIQGAAPRTIEDMLKLRLSNPDTYEGHPVTTLSVLPPGRWRAWVGGTGWTSIMAGRAGAEIAFTDRAGTHWIRRATGSLDELPTDPLDYFTQWGFYGPYDYQTPERLD